MLTGKKWKLNCLMNKRLNYKIKVKVNMMEIIFNLRDGNKNSLKMKRKEINTFHSGNW